MPSARCSVNVQTVGELWGSRRDLVQEGCLNPPYWLLDNYYSVVTISIFLFYVWCLGVKFGKLEWS